MGFSPVIDDLLWKILASRSSESEIICMFEHLHVIHLRAASVTCFVQAYHRQARIHHPDTTVVGGETSGRSAQQLLKVKTAYEYLQQHCTR